MTSKIAQALYGTDITGNPVTMTPEQAAHASEMGLGRITAEDASKQQTARVAQDYVDENWGTGGKIAAGLADGASLGLYPAVAQGLGLVDPNHLAAARTSGGYHAGELAGMLAPAILSGGESAAAEGAAGAAEAAEGGSAIGKALGWTPAGMVSRAGSAVGRTVDGFLPEAGVLGKLAKPVLSMAAQGATEGALINAAHTASESYIQNSPLTAQAMLASSADGALFGGLAGGALGGIGAVGRQVSDVAGSSLGGSRVGGALGNPLKRLGYSAEDLAAMGPEAEQRAILKAHGDILAGQGESFASDTPSIIRAVDKSVQQHGELADDVLRKLNTTHPVALSGESVTLAQEAVRDAVLRPNQATTALEQAMKATKRVNKELERMRVSEDTARPPATDPNDGGQWRRAFRSRDDLAEKYASATDQHLKLAYGTALKAVDEQLAKTMSEADPELAAQFTGFKGQERIGKQAQKALQQRQVVEAGRPGLGLDHGDVGQLGYAAISGRPVIGAALIAGKKIAQRLQQSAEPVMAEYAYRSALGANAATATMKLGQRTQQALDNFMTVGRRSAQVSNAQKGAPDPSTRSYSMQNYQASLRLAEELTSRQHQAKVRETMASIAGAGHPELAQAMGQTYGQAVAYVNANKPKGRMGGAKTGLTKPAKMLNPDTSAMKFIRQLHAIRDPQDAILGGLERGTVSRDEVAAAKFVYPDFMEDVVKRAHESVMAKEAAGEYMPVDKLALLSVVLDTPMDQSLTLDFIGEVQKGLAANSQPQQAPGKAAPQGPVTPISDYQTPNQQAAMPT